MAETTQPRIARHKAYYTELEQGRTYLWCRCGRSRSQPYCDGSHRGTGFLPVRYVAAEKGEEVLFCGCKHTKTPPFCDGSHNNLLADYPEDDPGSEANRAVPEVPCGEGGRSILNGGCYVFSTDRAPTNERGALRWCTVIGPELGSIHQSQFHFETGGAGDPPVIAFGERDVVLFVTEGEAEVNDLREGRSPRRPTPGSTSHRERRSASPWPGGGGTARRSGSWPPPVRARAPPSGSSGCRTTSTRPTRSASSPSTPPSARGCRTATSRCSSTGRWARRWSPSSSATSRARRPSPTATSTRRRSSSSPARAACGPRTSRPRCEAGDVIFLPRKQLHSLEATSPEGMLVVGTIYPGDNPAINY